MREPIKRARKLQKPTLSNETLDEALDCQFRAVSGAVRVSGHDMVTSEYFHTSISL